MWRTARLLALLAGPAAAAGLAASAAQAAGYISHVSPRYYSDHARFTVRYQVYDAADVCVKDEYGFYDNFDCDNYDTNSANLDFHVYKLRSHRPPRLVYSDTFYGDHGKAVEDLYMFELHTRYCGYGSRKFTVRYRVVFRLFDPVSDARLDSDARLFRYTCR